MSKAIQFFCIIFTNSTLFSRLYKIGFSLPILFFLSQQRPMCSGAQTHAATPISQNKKPRLSFIFPTPPHYNHHHHLLFYFNHFYTKKEKDETVDFFLFLASTYAHLSCANSRRTKQNKIKIRR